MNKINKAALLSLIKSEKILINQSTIKSNVCIERIVI